MTDIRRALTGDAEHPTLAFERVYRASPASVREACTSIERLARWFGEVRGEPTAVGDAFEALLSDDPADVAVGSVLRCDAEAIAVSWSWQGERESVITARIRSLDDERTALTLHHELAEAQHAVGYGGGWEQVLQALARSLGDASDDAPDDDRIEAEALERWRTITRAPLRMDRVIAAPIDAVWGAFATSDGLASWWWTHWSDVTIDADVRPGGAYRIQAPSAGIELRGTYLEVAAPEHLSWTWQWIDGDDASQDEAVDVRLATVDGGTRVTVQHSGPWADDAPAESYREGWAFTLGQLAAALA